MTQRVLSLILMAVFVLLAGCATVVPPPAAAPVSATEAEAAWAACCSASSTSAARSTSRPCRKTGPTWTATCDTWPIPRWLRQAGSGMQGTQAAQLAHRVNAYNALSMFNVVVSGIPATHAGFNKITFFYLRKLAVGGQVMSLYTFENEVIRKRLGAAS